MTKYLPFLIFLCFLIPHQAHAAVFYVDFSAATGCGTHTGVASSTDSAYCGINEFANVARNAGDIAYVRRGQASTTNVAVTNFLSDGTLNGPITIAADYDNLWGDFATSTATFAPKFGEVYIAASASSTGTLGPYPRNWIYFQGDCFEQASTTINLGLGIVNPCEYAYEVKLASSTGIELYLPYKGNQSGSGINTRVMPFAPQIGVVSTAAQILNFINDDYWLIKGLDVRTTNAGGPVALGAGNKGTVIYDMILQANGAGDVGFLASTYADYLKKSRVFNVVSGFNNHQGMFFEDGLIDCNSVASSNAIGNASFGGVFGTLKDVAFKNCTNDLIVSALLPALSFKFTNVKRNNTYSGLSGAVLVMSSFEDDFGMIGINSQTSNKIGANTDATTTTATTTNLRSGGGPINIFVQPPTGTGNTGLSTRYFPYSYLKLFEGRFYANASKTYTVFFNSTSTSNWTIDPLTTAAAGSSTPELWIECEYYNHASNPERILKRSTGGTVDFNGSAAWQSIAVTCAPSQAGDVFIRVWYAKPKETPANWFYMDGTIVVS